MPEKPNPKVFICGVDQEDRSLRGREWCVVQYDPLKSRPHYSGGI